MKKPLILIVEDDASVRNLLEITFKEYEFDSIASANKENAYRFF